MKLFKRKTPVQRCTVSRFLTVLKVTSILSDILYGRQGVD